MYIGLLWVCIVRKCIQGALLGVCSSFFVYVGLVWVYIGLFKVYVRLFGQGSYRCT